MGELRDIYTNLEKIDNSIQKLIKKKVETKEKILILLKQYEDKYLELKENRKGIISNYEYSELLKNRLNESKEKLLTIKYEIIYDLFDDTTKDKYTALEDTVNHLNEEYLTFIKKIKDKESSNIKKTQELYFQLQKIIDEYKYIDDINDIDSKKEIYSRFIKLQRAIMINKNIGFNLFEGKEKLRYTIDYRPYVEYLLDDLNKNKLSQNLVEEIMPIEIEEIEDNLSNTNNNQPPLPKQPNPQRKEMTSINNILASSNEES